MTSGWTLGPPAGTHRHLCIQETQTRTKSSWVKKEGKVNICRRFIILRWVKKIIILIGQSGLNSKLVMGTRGYHRTPKESTLWEDVQSVCPSNTHSVDTDGGKEDWSPLLAGDLPCLSEMDSCCREKSVRTNWNPHCHQPTRYNTTDYTLLSSAKEPWPRQTT